MKLKSLFVLILISYICNSCNILFPDEELTIEREWYYGDKFKINGYYYSIFGENGIWSSIKFFYTNGVVLTIIDSSSVVENNDFNDIEIWKNDKISWSAYVVNENEISQQGWDYGHGGSRPLKNYYFTIINDTTLRKVNDNNIHYYHFKLFSPKPDSMNNFIK